MSNRLGGHKRAYKLYLKDRKHYITSIKLFEKYGIENIENLDVLRLDPINTLGRPIEIFNLFGGKSQYLAALKDLEIEIYRQAA